MNQKLFIDKMNKIVLQTLEKLGLLTSEWHIGKVKSVDTGKLDVYIDGSEIPTPNVPCNPNITFVVGDEVFVHFVNRDRRNLFIPYKRSVS